MNLTSEEVDEIVVDTRALSLPSSPASPAKSMGIPSPQRAIAAS